jgi:hypothetical protein
MLIYQSVLNLVVSMKYHAVTVFTKYTHASMPTYWTNVDLFYTNTGVDVICQDDITVLFSITKNPMVRTTT